MTSTERKLDEARYFLGQLKTHDPYFDYILSAFLNAARSTAWVMRYEFGEIEGWESWFTNTKMTNTEEKLLKEINDFRIQTTKKRGIKTDFYLFDSIPVEEQYYPKVKEFLSKDGEYRLTIKPADQSLDKNKIQEDEDGDEVLRFTFTKDSSKEKSNLRDELYDFCRTYFFFLEKKVNECITKFNLIS